MCQLTNFGASNEEIESEIGIYAKKLSNIGPFRNFDIWLKVNAKSQSQLVQGQIQRIQGPGRFRVFRVGHRSGC